MRTVVLSAMTSLDGMFDGPGEGAERIDWMRADDEWEEYSVESLDAASTLLFGRRTFDGMAGYWPGRTDPVGIRMNALEKVGFSRSPRETAWENARISSDPVGEVARLKEGTGGNLLILGSADLAATLTGRGLIDEYRIAVNPVVLGAGSPLFRPGHPRLDLRPTGTRLFSSGIAEIRCAPV